jgi:hypothetical protein
MKFVFVDTVDQVISAALEPVSKKGVKKTKSKKSSGD